MQGKPPSKPCGSSGAEAQRLSIQSRRKKFTSLPFRSQNRFPSPIRVKLVGEKAVIRMESALRSLNCAFSATPGEISIPPPSKVFRVSEQRGQQDAGKANRLIYPCVLSHHLHRQLHQLHLGGGGRPVGAGLHLQHWHQRPQRRRGHAGVLLCEQNHLPGRAKNAKAFRPALIRPETELHTFKSTGEKAPFAEGVSLFVICNMIRVSIPIASFRVDLFLQIDSNTAVLAMDLLFS